jgi:GT2 family glycosyltransferase
MAAVPDPAVLFPPKALRSLFPLWAFGLEGPWLGRHLAETVSVLAAGRPDLVALHTALAVWRFERQPLDAASARALLACGRTGVRSGQRALARRLIGRLGPPEAARHWPALRDGPDRSAALDVLTRGMADPGCDLFWRGKALEYALGAGLPDLARQAVDGLSADAAAAPLFSRLTAEISAAFDGPDAVLAALAGVDRDLFSRFSALAGAQSLIDAGDRAGGTGVLRRLWQRENWHPGLTLRLHELLFPVPGLPVDRLPGRVVVWLYTWNRAGALGRTLTHLAASRLGSARVVVLDNGAADDTRVVCRTLAERFAPGRFETIRLPVNIGAPAARNWLAATAGLGPDDLGAYLDDDALVPQDWLEVLAGALAADPEADVAGARILAGDSAVPLSADVRLLPPERGSRVRPLVNCPLGPDFGLLAASRPCASVSGCCHLFRGRALTGPSPFDIRFSPSQFDDLARDLAAFLAGRRCVLAGEAAVAHHQPAKAADGRLGTLGARVKLDGLFSAEAMARAAARDLHLAWDELEAKWSRLAGLSRACTGRD